MANDKTNFLYPRSRYTGQFSPQNLLFNANLQEFAQKVSYISAFHTNGKLSKEKALAQLKQLWEKLEDSTEQV